MNSAWPAILLTSLAGAGQGLFLALAWVVFLGPAPGAFLIAGSILVVALVAASALAPGERVRAWPAVLSAFLATAAAFGALSAAGVAGAIGPWLAGGGIALCVALFACAGRRFHSARAPLPAAAELALLGAASGFTLSVPLAVLSHPRVAGPLALAAFSLCAAAWVLRALAFALDVRRRRRTEPALRAANWIFLALLFPMPGWLLGWGGGTLGAYVAAFALQFTGLVAERWSSGARPPSNVTDR
ncbi:MAG: hypothetical protein ACT4P9_16965 [Betaproteobacteria bacterium]